MKKCLLMTLFAFGAVSVSFGDCVSNCEAVAKNTTALTTCLAGCPKSTNASKKIDLLPMNQFENTHKPTTMPTITPKPTTGSRTYIDSYSELRVGSESSVGDDCVSSCEAVYGSDDMAMSRCIVDCYKDDSSKPISIESLQPSSLPDSDFDNELKALNIGNRNTGLDVPMKQLNDNPANRNDNITNRLKLLGVD